MTTYTLALFLLITPIAITLAFVIHGLVDLMITDARITRDYFSKHNDGE